MGHDPHPITYIYGHDPHPVAAYIHAQSEWGRALAVCLSAPNCRGVGIPVVIQDQVAVRLQQHAKYIIWFSG